LRTEEHVRRVVDAIPTTAWTLRADGAVDFVNRRYLEYTGLSLKQVLAEPNAVIHPDDTASAVEAWLDALGAGRAYEAEMRLRRADGQYRWFMVRAVPFRDRKGHIIRWFGASYEIEGPRRTDRPQAREHKALASLSAREREVLQMLAEGYPTARIALRLALSRKTVETFRLRAMKKLGLKSLPALVKFALRHGLVALE